MGIRGRLWSKFDPALTRAARKTHYSALFLSVISSYRLCFSTSVPTLSNPLMDLFIEFETLKRIRILK